MHLWVHGFFTYALKAVHSIHLYLKAVHSIHLYLKAISPYLYWKQSQYTHSKSSQSKSSESIYFFFKDTKSIHLYQKTLKPFTCIGKQQSVHTLYLKAKSTHLYLKVISPCPYHTLLFEGDGNQSIPLYMKAIFPHTRSEGNQTIAFLPYTCISIWGLSPN